MIHHGYEPCSFCNKSSMSRRSGYAVISSRTIVQMKPNNDMYLISVNGKIKQWRFFSQPIQNSNIPSVGDYLNIVCALINAYHNTRVIDPTAEREQAAQMFLLLNKENRLKGCLEHLLRYFEKRFYIVVSQICLLQDHYQIQQAKGYIKEHLKPSPLDEDPTTGWFCTCACGSRVFGCCAHATALI